MKERVVVGWSGGKDSALALREIVASDAFEVVALVTTVTSGYDRISMHGVRCSLLEQQAAAIGLPLRKVTIPPGATNEQYEAAMHEALREFKRSGVTRVVFGDLFLAEIRAYRDRMLAEVGMTAIYPVWGRNTTQLARDFIALGFEAVLVCVDPKQIDPAFAGRHFDLALLRDLPPTADPCGENGEFHTFVYDGPVFRRAVPVQKGDAVTRSGFCFCDFLPVNAPSGNEAIHPEAPDRPAREKRCSACGAAFVCGPAQGQGKCWCDELPAIGPMAGPGQDCLCPDCLRVAIARKAGTPQTSA